MTSTSSVASSKQSTKSLTLAYLSSYESMVRRQDEECVKTYDFWNGVVMDRLRYLGREKQNHSTDKSSDSPSSYSSSKEKDTEGMLTYHQMRRSLLRLNYSWNRILPPQSCDDDLSIVSELSRTSRVSGASGKVLGGRKKRDVVGRDQQLILLLCVLVEMEERWRVEKGGKEDGAEIDSSNNEDSFSKGLYLPELMQAYQLVIGGMQALQSLNKLQKTPDCLSMEELSERIRERTKCLLRSFGPHHIPSREVLASPIVKSKSGRYSSRDGLLSSPTKKLFASPRPTPSMDTSPRNDSPDVRKLMHTKDTTLAKIVEEHEVEMDAMVQDMEALKVQESVTRNLLRSKRRRSRLLLGLGLVLVIGFLFYWDYLQKQWVQTQIDQGRSEERHKSQLIIQQLTQQTNELQSKLEMMEGRARYMHSRSFDLESKQNRTLSEIGSMEQQWWLDQAEMGRCRSDVRENGERMERIREQVAELEEEGGWCTNRLKGRDAELNSLRYTRMDDGSSSAAMVSFVSNDASTSTSPMPKSQRAENSSRNQPVKLEMKYNPSVRNAMIVRQVYSGVGVGGGREFEQTVWCDDVVERLWWWRGEVGGNWLLMMWWS